MKTRARLILLILVQTACVAAGLGFGRFYFESALRHRVKEQAQKQLDPLVEKVAGALAGSKSTGGLLRPETAESLSRLINDSKIDGDQPLPGVVVTDGDGRLCWISEGTVADAEICNAEGTLVWAIDDWHRASAAKPFYHLIHHAGGDCIVAVLAREDQPGYIAAYSKLATARLPFSAVLSLQGVGAIVGFLWTCAILAISLYLVVNYFEDQSSQGPAEADVESLKQAQSLVRTQETIIFALAKLSDSRDPDTGHHLERISYYSVTLASALRQHADFRDQITPSFMRLIGISSALHDIGKVGVEDAILRKPGSLTRAERRRMMHHTQVGEECLKQIERRLGTSNFLQMAREIASAHHERWDGCGYPRGLVEEQIPLAARIVAIADVYDALSSKRVYKEALPHEESVAIIAAEAGKHFDPRIVEVFLQVESSFRTIARQLASQDSATTQEDDSAVSEPPAEAARELPLSSAPR